MNVIIGRLIRARYPADNGTWWMRTERELPALPRVGDYVELAEGWASRRVESVTFKADGKIFVVLEGTDIKSLGTMAELFRLTDEHGWAWTGGAPRRPTPEEVAL